MTARSDIVLVPPQGPYRNLSPLDTMSTDKTSNILDTLNDLMYCAERIEQAAAAIQSAIQDAQSTLEDEEADPCAGMRDLIGSELDEIESELENVRGGDLDAREFLGSL